MANTKHAPGEHDLDESEQTEPLINNDEIMDQAPLLTSKRDEELPQAQRPVRKQHSWSTVAIGILSTGFVVIALGYLLFNNPRSGKKTATCDSIEKGYQCSPEISHHWGQYSPWFSVPSEIDASVPEGCKITFVQMLARHGARDPTTSKTLAYAALTEKLHTDVEIYSDEFAFLADYTYTLGANSLTAFGKQQMFNAGIKFYNRYHDLFKGQAPFIRAAGSQRVVESAELFSHGFDLAVEEDGMTKSEPHNIVIISEELGQNNTLNGGNCDNFDKYLFIAREAKSTWINVFVPSIQARINAGLHGANITQREVIYLMDLCPFETVQTISGQLSKFCDLFTVQEWEAYGYYESLEKWYGYANGNPLGSTQGVGFTNELIARMTNQPLQDATSTNHTLDSSNSTFPIGTGQVLFADFSHDNDMMGMFAAMGLYNDTMPLSKEMLQTTNITNGYSAAWTVPFGARAYFEKMTCDGHAQELVRVLVNDRVMPLGTCGGDILGRCTLYAWVESLSFARHNGKWSDCFS